MANEEEEEPEEAEEDVKVTPQERVQMVVNSPPFEYFMVTVVFAS